MVESLVDIVKRTEWLGSLLSLDDIGGRAYLETVYNNNVALLVEQGHVSEAIHYKQLFLDYKTKRCRR